MLSHAHLVHCGAGVALFSAAPALPATTTRVPVLTVNCRGRGVRSQHYQECGCGAKVKPRTSVSQTVVRRLSCGVKGFICSLRGEGNRVTSAFLVRDAAVMHRLQIATKWRIPVDTRNGNQCLACASSNNSRNGAGGERYEKNTELADSPPQDAVLKAISEVSKAEGRVGKTTNIVIGGTLKDDSEREWNAIDQKVNVYPMVRDFTAIGTGGDEFVQAMVRAVESITETQVSKVTKKLSSQGKYISVKIGGVTVASSEQVRAVYDAMRKDLRMKYFL